MLRTATPSITLTKLEAYFNFLPTYIFADDQIRESVFLNFGLSELDLVEIGAHTWVGEDRR